MIGDEIRVEPVAAGWRVHVRPFRPGHHHDDDNPSDPRGDAFWPSEIEACAFLSRLIDEDALGVTMRLPDGRAGVVQQRCRFNQRVARDPFGAEADGWVLLDVAGAAQWRPGAGLVSLGFLRAQWVLPRRAQWVLPRPSRGSETRPAARPAGSGPGRTAQRSAQQGSAPSHAGRHLRGPEGGGGGPRFRVGHGGGRGEGHAFRRPVGPQLSGDGGARRGRRPRDLRRAGDPSCDFTVP